MAFGVTASVTDRNTAHDPTTKGWLQKNGLYCCILFLWGAHLKVSDPLLYSTYSSTKIRQMDSKKMKLPESSKQILKSVLCVKQAFPFHLLPKSHTSADSALW